jgi:hypothetical protein
LILHRVSDVRQTEIHRLKPLVPDPSPLEVEIAIAELKRYKSPSSDQIPAYLFEAGGKTFRYESLKLINSVSNREELPEQWKSLLLFEFTRIVIKLIVVINDAYHWP